MNFVDEVYNSLKTKSFERYSTQNILKDKKQLAKAIKLATNVHDGQFDKGGNPYILHPLHLMTQML